MTEPSPNDGLDALFAKAREQRADTSAAEYAFETRLMARLREERSPGTIWAMVSWRLTPFFAVCVLGLGLWALELSSETDEAAAFASLENPTSTDLWKSLD